MLKREAGHTKSIKALYRHALRLYEIVFVEVVVRPTIHAVLAMYAVHCEKEDRSGQWLFIVLMKVRRVMKVLRASLYHGSGLELL